MEKGTTLVSFCDFFKIIIIKKTGRYCTCNEVQNVVHCTAIPQGGSNWNSPLTHFYANFRNQVVNRCINNLFLNGIFKFIYIFIDCFSFWSAFYWVQQSQSAQCQAEQQTRLNDLPKTQNVVNDRAETRTQVFWVSQFIALPIEKPCAFYK